MGEFPPKAGAKQERKRLKETVLPPTEQLNRLLVSCETTPVSTGVRLEDLLRRPQLDYQKLAPVDSQRPELDPMVREQIEVEIKYEGYIRRQRAAIDELRRLESRLLPDGIDYSEIKGLRKEAQEKLNRIRPANLGQASRIRGVSPADLSVLVMAGQPRRSRRQRKLGMGFMRGVLTGACCWSSGGNRNNP